MTPLSVALAAERRRTQRVPKVPLNLRVVEPMRDWLQDVANAEGISVNQFVVACVVAAHQELSRPKRGRRGSPKRISERNSA